MNNAEIKGYVFSEILNQLEMINEWSSFPLKITEKFDIDNCYSLLKKNFGDKMELPFVSEIYNLTDVLCDSLRHNQININQNYSVCDGLSDLNKIIKLIKDKDFSKLENDYQLKERLQPNKLYR